MQAWYLCMVCLIIIFWLLIFSIETGSHVHQQRKWFPQSGGCQSHLSILQDIHISPSLFFSFPCIWFSFQLKDTREELDECRRSLNACLEDNSKLSRWENLFLLFSQISWSLVHLVCPFMSKTLILQVCLCISHVLFVFPICCREIDDLRIMLSNLRSTPTDQDGDMASKVFLPFKMIWLGWFHYQLILWNKKIKGRRNKVRI